MSLVRLSSESVLMQYLAGMAKRLETVSDLLLGEERDYAVRDSRELEGELKRARLKFEDARRGLALAERAASEAEVYLGLFREEVAQRNTRRSSLPVPSKQPKPRTRNPIQ